MEVKDFRDLIVWQKSRELVVKVYKTTKTLPKDELYGLTSQMRRAAVSIPSNIAEGNQRKSTKEYINFLSIAKGSNAELQTQLYICQDLGYLSNDQTSELFQLTDSIGKMITSIISKLS